MNIDTNINKTGTGTEEIDARDESKKGIGKKRGPKKKQENIEMENEKEQRKFFIDLSKENEQRQIVQNFLVQANNKKYGREIILKDLVLIALTKLTQKDIEKAQENSLDEMERVQRALDVHNIKNETNLSLGEFLVKRLSII